MIQNSRRLNLFNKLSHFSTPSRGRTGCKHVSGGISASIVKNLDIVEQANLDIVERANFGYC